MEDEGKKVYIHSFLLLLFLTTRKCTTVIKFLTFCAQTLKFRLHLSFY